MIYHQLYYSAMYPLQKVIISTNYCFFWKETTTITEQPENIHNNNKSTVGRKQIFFVDIRYKSTHQTLKYKWQNTLNSSSQKKKSQSF